jgi:hypothetical protein
LDSKLLGHVTLTERFKKYMTLQSTIKPTYPLYFLSMSVNPAYVLAAIEPSSGVQGHNGHT